MRLALQALFAQRDLLQHAQQVTIVRPTQLIQICCLPNLVKLQPPHPTLQLSFQLAISVTAPAKLLMVQNPTAQPVSLITSLRSLLASFLQPIAPLTPLAKKPLPQAAPSPAQQ